MAKNLDNLVDEVRLMLKDRRTPYRFTDSDVLASINSAFREAKRLRPDIFLTVTGSIALPDFVPANLGSAVAFPIDEIFFIPIAYYSVGKLQLGDDEFAIDNRAMALLTAFHQQLVGA